MANTYIIEGDTITRQQAEQANEALASFTGSKENIEKARKFIESKDQLSEKQVRQLDAILYAAGANPEMAG